MVSVTCIHFCWAEEPSDGSSSSGESRAQVLTQCKEAYEQALSADEDLKALASKYPVVMLHSRRFCKNDDYFQSAYSFNYEVSDPKKHFNDVQLLFDNGTGRNLFQVNMHGGQTNTVEDLGAIDFDKSVDAKNAGKLETCVAQQDHVYLERVADSRGNNFMVLFKVVVFDPQSRYVAFIWRKLPGGKVVKGAQALNGTAGKDAS